MALLLLVGAGFWGEYYHDDRSGGLGTPQFDVIFTTAYDEFGIKAIKYSALDYLLKPIQVEELKLAIEKHLSKSQAQISSEQLEVLFSNIKDESKGPFKIALSTKESVQFVEPHEIIACQGYLYLIVKPYTPLQFREKTSISSFVIPSIWAESSAFGRRLI